MRVEEENKWKAKVCIYQFPQIIILSESREKIWVLHLLNRVFMCLNKGIRISRRKKKPQS